MIVSGPKNAKRYCNAIPDRLCEIQPDQKSDFYQRKVDVVARITELDASYQEKMSKSLGNFLLLRDVLKTTDARVLRMPPCIQ